MLSYVIKNIYIICYQDFELFISFVLLLNFFLPVIVQVREVSIEDVLWSTKQYVYSAKYAVGRSTSISLKIIYRKSIRDGGPYNISSFQGFSLLLYRVPSRCQRGETSMCDHKTTCTIYKIVTRAFSALLHHYDKANKFTSNEWDKIKLKCAI